MLAWAIILTLAGIFLLASCVTEKQRAKICAICQGHDSTSTSADTAWHEVVRVDTTWQLLEVPVAGPIQYLPHPCASLCDSLGHLKAINQAKSNKGIRTQIKTSGDTLKFDCATDSLMQIIERHKITEEITKRSYEEKIQQAMKDRPVTWYDIAGRWALGLDIAALLILLVLGVLHFTNRI